MRTRYAPETWEVSVKELREAVLRWQRMGFSAIFRCVETEGVGMKKFLEVADKTQRDLVGKTAVEFYVDGLGLKGDNMDTFFGVTNLGVVGSGFDYEVNRTFTETSVSAEQYRCPLMDEIMAAGYDVGDPAIQDVSLWCDMYDNFESAAVAPSIGMIHSHCLGRGDKCCRWYIEVLDPEVRRKEGEHVYDYLSRMRDSYRAKGDEPWVIDGLPPEEVERLTRENVKVTEDQQDLLWETLDEKLKQGVLVSSRNGACSTLIAGELLGWDVFIDRMAEKEGKILTEDARTKCNELGIHGDSAIAGYDLFRALRLGMLYGPYKVEEKTPEKVVCSCDHCPLIEAGLESELGAACKNVMPHCSAVATYQMQALDKDLTQTFTHCLGKGDDRCRFVIEKK